MFKQPRPFLSGAIRFGVPKMVALVSFGFLCEFYDSLVLSDVFDVQLLTLRLSIIGSLSFVFLQLLAQFPCIGGNWPVPFVCQCQFPRFFFLFFFFLIILGQ